MDDGHARRAGGSNASPEPRSAPESKPERVPETEPVPDDGADPGQRSGPAAVLGLLNDEPCRDIVAGLDRPMTVPEIAASVDVSLATAYRKLDRLAEAGLVRDRLELRRGGHHRSRYVSLVDRIAVSLDEGRRFRVTVEPGVDDGESTGGRTDERGK